MQIPWERPERWQRFSHAALAAWLVFYAFILLVPMERTPIGKITWLYNLAIFPHEGGHIVTGWVVDSSILSFFGRVLRRIAQVFWARAQLINDDVVVAAAGAIGQLSAAAWPLIYFWWRKHTMAVAFCLFWFFENFVGIGVYMLDSRLMMFNYVGPGMNSPGWNPAEAHDWSVIFTSLIIPFERGEHFGQNLYYFGWFGMTCSVAWFIWMHFRTAEGPALPLAWFKGGASGKTPDVVEPGPAGSAWDLRVTTARRKPEWQAMVQVEYSGAYYHVAEIAQEPVGGKSMYRYYLRKAAETEAFHGVIHYDPFSE